MYKWKPSKTEARAYAEKMEKIKAFCEQNGIYQSRAGDSYYFTLNGVNYRVSNHTTQASDAGAFDIYGEKIRELYHDNDDKIINIIAGKTRIIEIYNDLKEGYDLDGRGNRRND